ncbi:LacI family DNA-binding transcriptional regulator [Pseudorhizobium marinum]|uniref:LacI family DNA-binding transcriptional regulator n=1 Tax=Pseudorhizobium marinum TaxID=1496690 RepID=UPI000689CC9E|nr:LacI family DNA-binding transcriptional regulator [Pseudorhizobium marinum]MBU1314718.1 LacI family transcriptional regulator [Alphaproteobacteria bacterium]MBU1551276.1 LacI family transcriptional regulator [Alphaproteobacteria bacterium]MBU2334789.1 LacI family transcriptional regulator [Alphaproteobacteria bacterium]MBU2389292.1 LacI family transcriptional regulator [Alphaproteobacteria bacterium]
MGVRRRARRGITIVDVAEALGVAPSTVSNALHDKDIVAPHTKARILAMAKAMNYQASAAARALVTRQSSSVGVILPDFANPVFNEIISGLNSVLAQAGYATLVASTSNDGRTCKAAIHAFVKRDVDAIVVISQSLDVGETAQLAGCGLPVVLVHRTPADWQTAHAPSSTFDYVGMDNAGGVRALVDHLAGLGHRRIGFITGPLQSSAACERTEGFRHAVMALGLDADPQLLVEGSYDFIAGMRGARALLSLTQRPTAVIAANDLMAFGTMDVAQQMGLAVPRDLSIVGIDDVFFSAFPMISLTTARQPAIDIGESVGERLLERFFDDAPCPIAVTLPVEVIVRHSTAPVPDSIDPGRPLSVESLEAYLTSRWKPSTVIVA